LYLQHTLKTPEKTGLKKQVAYGSLQMLHRNIGRNVKSTMEDIEFLADFSDEKYQAEVAYNRLMKATDRLNDPDFFPTRPLLIKMVAFYERNDEPFQAEEIWRRLAEERPTCMTRYDFTRILDSYQKTSCHMSEMLQSLNLSGTPLNDETPCPPFHRALQHEVPENILNMMSASSDIPDILLRQNMHVAIEAGREDLIDGLIESRAGSGVDTRDAFSRTPLQVAAQLRRSSAFKALAIAGADRKARDVTGRTTLEMAARAGCPIMVSTLLDDKIKGPRADVNDEVSWNTSTPLQAAAEEGHSEVVDILLERGAQVAQVRLHDGKTAAQLASESGHRNIAERLLAKVDPMLCSFGPDEMCDSQTEMDFETG
jgi:ankyrin repeat protein